jgi:hypothetical protein
MAEQQKQQQRRHLQINANDKVLSMEAEKVLIQKNICLDWSEGFFVFLFSSFLSILYGKFE